MKPRAAVSVRLNARKSCSSSSRLLLRRNGFVTSTTRAKVKCIFELSKFNAPRVPEPPSLAFSYSGPRLHSPPGCDDFYPPFSVVAALGGSDLVAYLPAAHHSPCAHASRPPHPLPFDTIAQLRQYAVGVLCQSVFTQGHKTVQFKEGFKLGRGGMSFQGGCGSRIGQR